MKLKELPPDTNLGGLKVKLPDGRVGYWRSQWARGVWLGNTPSGDTRLTPVFLDNVEYAIEWELADDKEPVKL